MKNNLEDKILDTKEASNYLLDAMQDVRTKIATSKLVRGVSKAVSCVSGVISGVYLFGAAGTSDFADYAHFSLSQAERAVLESNFHDGLTKGIVAGVAAAGFFAASYLLGKYIESKQDDLHSLRVAYHNNNEELKNLENEENLNNILGIKEGPSYEELIDSYRNDRFYAILKQTENLENNSNQDGDGREE